MKDTRWTDDRLDDLNGKVDDLARRMDNGFARVDTELGALSLRIDSLQRTMIVGFAGIAGSVIASAVGAIVTVLVTQS